MKTKIKTNETMIKSLLNDLSSIETAILRERIVKIMEITTKSIENEPEEWGKNPIIHPSLYLNIAKKVNEHLGFDKD